MFWFAINQLKNLVFSKHYELIKKQYKVENVFVRLKGPLQVIPIRLEKPSRIESMMFLLTVCVQAMTLMDKIAEDELSAKNKKLYGLMVFLFLKEPFQNPIPIIVAIGIMIGLMAVIL